MFRRRTKRNQLASDSLEGLLSPNWEAVSRELNGVPIPRALRELYATPELIGLVDVVIDKPRVWDIQAFEPADGKMDSRIDRSVFPSGAFVFAVNNCGDYYYTLLSAETPNNPVYKTTHGDHDFSELIAERFDDFLEKIKHAATQHA
jgi:SMI1 / KNR4 family (SUKH-1)